MGVLFLIFLPAAHRTLNCMVGQMKHILATEQKKTDFRPEDENNVMIQYTTVREKNLQLALRSSHSKLNKLAKETCKSNPHLVFLRLNTDSVSDWTCFPCFSLCIPHLTGLLQGMCLRQSAGGARAEVHGWEKCGHSADGVGHSFPPAHPWASTAIQLQLNGRDAGHLRRGWIPTMRQGLQGECGVGWGVEHRSRMHWSQGKHGFSYKGSTWDVLLNKLVRPIQNKGSGILC